MPLDIRCRSRPVQRPPLSTTFSAGLTQFHQNLCFRVAQDVLTIAHENEPSLARCAHASDGGLRRPGRRPAPRHPPCFLGRPSRRRPCRRHPGRRPHLARQRRRPLADYRPPTAAAPTTATKHSPPTSTACSSSARPAPPPPSGAAKPARQATSSTPPASSTTPAASMCEAFAVAAASRRPRSPASLLAPDAPRRSISALPGWTICWRASGSPTTAVPHAPIAACLAALLRAGVEQRARGRPA